jgi:hypothetical protein
VKINKTNFNHGWKKMQNWPQQNQLKTRLIQQSLHYNQYGRPIKQFRKMQPSQTLQQRRQPGKSSLINQQRRQPIRPLRTLQQQRQPGRPSRTLQQQRQPVRPSRTLQQQRQPVRPSQTLQQQRQPVRPSRTLQQQRQPVRPSHMNNQQRQRVKPSLPSPRIRRRSQLEKTVNRKRFFTPQDLLMLAPKQDKAMWELIISRLPSNYSIPDPEFIHIYNSYNNRKQ